MRRFGCLFGIALILGCPKKSRDETSHVAPDPVLPPASASVTVTKPPPPADPFTATIEPRVAAHGDDVAWVDLDSRIGHTLDGGAHWDWLPTPRKFSFDPFTIAPGDGSAWVTLNDETAKKTTILRCDGTTWTDVTPKLPSMPTGDWLGAVYPWDRDVAFLARSDESTPTKLTLLSTRDGGKTWKRDDVATFAYVRDARFYPLDRDRVWVMGEIDHGMSSMPGQLWLTDDGGTTGWKVVTAPPPNAGDLGFLDHARGFLLASETTTSPPNLWRTEDEGLSWKKIFSETDAIENMPVFQGDHAVLVADRFQITSDGGKTWRMGSFRPEGPVGQYGSVLWHVKDAHFETSDGTTWKTRSAREALLEGEVWSIVVATEKTGWMVVGTKDGKWRIVGTHDGGATFNAYGPPR